MANRQKKMNTLLLSLILLGTLVSAATLGIFIYSEILYERPLPSDKIEKEKLIEDSKAAISPDIYKVDKLIINLNSTTNRLRFLDVEIHLVPFKSESIEKFNVKKFYIKDAIIDIASNMSPEDLNSVAGKVLLEERIKKRLNSLFKTPLVKKIFFSRFVIQ